MPLEQRLQLSSRLKAFDALDRAEQAAVRELDGKLRAESEEERESDFTVLRRYHLWLRSLPEAQRDAINSAPVSSRLTTAAKIRNEQRAERPPGSVTSQLADFGSVSPFDLAQLIKVWLALPPDQKTAVSQLKENERRARLIKLGQERKIAPIPRPDRDETAALYERAIKNKRYAFVKKAEELKTQERDKVRQRLVDHYYFIEHPPVRVPADKLLAFDHTLPVWIRDGFDSLSPDEARRRLTVLYQLVNAPVGATKPVNPTEAASKGATRAPTPRPVPKKDRTPPTAPRPSSGANPF